MKATIQQAQADGFVSTIFGRSRVIDGLDIQTVCSRYGPAHGLHTGCKVMADIIKPAMNHAHQALIGCQSKMVLQVHDESVFDIHPNEAKTLIPLLKRCKHFRLEVPLVVDVEAGTSWGDIKPVIRHTIATLS